VRIEILAVRGHRRQNVEGAAQAEAMNMTKFLSTVAIGAFVLSSAAAVTPAFALVLQKTIVLQRFGERAVTTDTAVSPKVSLACNGGAGKCVYETLASVQMGGNNAASNNVGAYLSIDGSAPPCQISAIPSDGSFFERTTVLANQEIARGAHTVQLRLCSSAGGFHIEAYTATIRVYTAQ
jgi:hypothetical protein